MDATCYHGNPAAFDPVFDNSESAVDSVEGVARMNALIGSHDVDDQDTSHVTEGSNLWLAIAAGAPSRANEQAIACRRSAAAVSDMLSRL